MMKRPKLKIELEPIDKFLEAIGIIGLLFLVGLPIWFYSGLPEVIPSHFDINGEIDSFSNKKKIWLLPMIGLNLFFVISILNQYPHVFSYLQKITAENATRKYKMATRTLRVLKTCLAIIFAYLTYATIQIALGNQIGLGLGF